MLSFKLVFLHLIYILSSFQTCWQALDAIDKALQLKPKDPKVVSELFFTKGNQLREQNLLDKAFEV